MQKSTKKHCIENPHCLHCNQLIGIYQESCLLETHMFNKDIISWTKTMRGTKVGNGQKLNENLQ